MKKYYLDGVEITPEAAADIIAENARAVEAAILSGNIGDMEKCRFITVIEAA